MLDRWLHIGELLDSVHMRNTILQSSSSGDAWLFVSCAASFFDQLQNCCRHEMDRTRRGRTCSDIVYPFLKYVSLSNMHVSICPAIFEGWQGLILQNEFAIVVRKKRKINYRRFFI